MATYTVTRVITRPNTSIQWPHEALGLSGADRILENVIISTSFDSDNLVQTSSYAWDSKADYINNLPNKDNPTPPVHHHRIKYNAYMSLNDITGKSTEEDGAVRVFNASNKTWEVQE